MKKLQQGKVESTNILIESRPLELVVDKISSRRSGGEQDEVPRVMNLAL